MTASVVTASAPNTGAVDVARRERTKEKLRQGLLLVTEALQELAKDGVSAREAHAICNEVKEGLVGYSTVKRHYKAFKDAGIYTPLMSSNPEALKKRKQREKGTKAHFEPMSPGQSTCKTDHHDQRPVRPPAPQQGSNLVAEAVPVPAGVQVCGPSIDIRDFAPVLDRLLFGIEAARDSSLNTASEWRNLEACLRTLYEHANCERRQRETAESVDVAAERMYH